MTLWIRKYCVFTSRAYRWLLLLIIPAVSFGLSLLFGEIGILSVILGYGLFIVVDLFGDFWVFGGVCSKHSLRMDYMKSSFYGEKLLRTGIVMDMVRRLLWMLLVGGGGMVLVCSTQHVLTIEILPYSGAIALLGYTVNMATLNFLRYIETLQIYSFFVAFVSGISSGIMTRFGELVMAGEKDVRFWWKLFAVTVVLAAIVSVSTICHMMYKIRQSYFDGMEKGE